MSIYDWPAFDSKLACNAGTGVFSDHKDHNGTYICSSSEKATVGGTVHTGDIVAVTVTDTILGVNNPHSVGYAVMSTDTTTAKVAIGLANAINGDSILHTAGVTATVSGSVVTISSGTNASAWPHYFTNADSSLWAELFAEETAIVAGQNERITGTL